MSWEKLRNQDGGKSSAWTNHPGTYLVLWPGGSFQPKMSGEAATEEGKARDAIQRLARNTGNDDYDRYEVELDRAAIMVSSLVLKIQQLSAYSGR